MIVIIFSIYFIRQPEIVDCDRVCDNFSAGTSTVLVQISIKETVVSEVQIFDRTFCIVLLYHPLVFTCF